MKISAGKPFDKGFCNKTDFEYLLFRDVTGKEV